MNKPRNPLPTRCEVCGSALPQDATGHHRYKLVMVRGRYGIPLSLRACRACHYDSLHPSETAGLPLFATA